MKSLKQTITLLSLVLLSFNACQYTERTSERDLNTLPTFFNQNYGSDVQNFDQTSLGDFFHYSTNLSPTAGRADYINDSASDGSSIYLTGALTDDSGRKHMILFKSDENGEKSTDFSVFIDTRTGESEGNALVVDKFNNIYVAGYLVNSDGNKDIAIWKISNAGTLQKTTLKGDFGGVNLNGDELANDIALDNDNNIYITGRSQNTSAHFDMFIAKFSDQLELDVTFNGHGFDTQSATAGSDFKDSGRAIAIDNERRHIYVAGESQNTDNNAVLTLWRYNFQGALDTNFNNGKTFIYDSPIGDDRANDIAINNNGDIYIAGMTTNQNNDAILIRYRYDIVNDYFSTIISNPEGDFGDDEALSLALDNRGNVYLTGYSTYQNQQMMTLWKFEDNNINYLDGIVSPVEGRSFGRTILLNDNSNKNSLDIYIGGDLQEHTDTDISVWLFRQFL